MLKNTRKNNDHPKLARTRWMHFERVRVITSILNWYSLKNVLSIDGVERSITHLVLNTVKEKTASLPE